MNTIFLVAAYLVSALMVPYLHRAIVGPSVFDRIVALNGLGTKVPILLVLIGLLYNRLDMFIDIALGLFLLNVFTTLLVAKYVREKGGL